MWRLWLKHKLTVRPTVALFDVDGEISLRLARRVGVNWYAPRYEGRGSRWVRLNPDGSCAGVSWVKRWEAIHGSPL